MPSVTPTPPPDDDELAVEEAPVAPDEEEALDDERVVDEAAVEPDAVLPEDADVAGGTHTRLKSSKYTVGCEDPVLDCKSHKTRKNT